MTKTHMRTTHTATTDVHFSPTRHFTSRHTCTHTHTHTVGFMEQAVVDTIGRCFNGLNHAPELREHVKVLIDEAHFMQTSQASMQHYTAMLDKHGKTNHGTHAGVDRKFINLQHSHGQLSTLMLLDNASNTTWKSLYCMERIYMNDPAYYGDDVGIVSGLKPLPKGAGPAGTSLFSRTCSYCGKTGSMKACSRCKSVRYCGKACQRAHWKVHKIDCVTQSLPSKPTTFPVPN